MNYNDKAIEVLDNTMSGGINCWVSDLSHEHAITNKVLGVIDGYEAEEGAVTYFYDDEGYDWLYVVPLTVEPVSLED